MVPGLRYFSLASMDRVMAAPGEGQDGGALAQPRTFLESVKLKDWSKLDGGVVGGESESKRALLQ